MVIATYFLVQAILLLVERYVRVRCWYRPLQRVWLVTAALSGLPLLLEALLGIVFE